MTLPITPEDKEALRAKMPEVLESRLGICNLHRPFHCPDPDHEDVHPSASYNASNHTVHCFSCGGTWDVFSLLGMLDSIDGFVEQAKHVALEVGYPLRLVDSGDNRSAQRKPKQANESLFPVPNEPNLHLEFDVAFKMYEALFSSKGNIAREYLHSRGIDDVCMVNHGFGFAKDPSQVIEQFSIYEPKVQGFIMIPFFDQGCTVANYCIARPVGIGPFTRKEWGPKKVTSTLWREWLLYTGASAIYVTEGIFDALSLEMLIEKPCIALCGTSGISRLASILHHMPKDLRPAKLMIAMDCDEAGRSAASRLAADLNKIGIPHGYLPPFPGGVKDANEWHVSRCKTEWTFETSHLADDTTPLHVLRSIQDEH